MKKPARSQKPCPRCPRPMTTQDAARFGCCWGCVRPARLGGDIVAACVASFVAVA